MYPVASEIGDSRIWNTPYLIDYTSIDHYPFVREVDISEILEFSSWVMLIFVIVTLFSVVAKRNISKFELNTQVS